MCAIYYSIHLTIFIARWGRCQEGYGEDPYVQAQLATQYVTALQNVKSSKYVEAVVSQYDCRDTLCDNYVVVRLMLVVETLHSA